MADQNGNIPATVPEQPESKPPLRKSMPIVIVLVVIVALTCIANISSLLSGNKRSAPQSSLTISPTTPNAQQVSSFETQQQQRDDLLHFIAHGAQTLDGGVIRCGYRQENTNSRSVIFPVLSAFNLNLASMTFNKLLCHKQDDPCSHSVAGCEEGFKYPWQINLRDPNTVVLNGQDDAIGEPYCVFHGDGQDAARLHRVNRVHDQV